MSLVEVCSLWESLQFVVKINCKYSLIFMRKLVIPNQRPGKTKENSFLIQIFCSCKFMQVALNQNGISCMFYLWMRTCEPTTIQIFLRYNIYITHDRHLCFFFFYFVVWVHGGKKKTLTHDVFILFLGVVSSERTPFAMWINH